MNSNLLKENERLKGGATPAPDAGRSARSNRSGDERGSPAARQPTGLGSARGAPGESVSGRKEKEEGEKKRPGLKKSGEDKAP